MTLLQYRRAAEFESALGDPDDERNVFSFRRAVALDERDECPAEACALLDRIGLSREYVPTRDGGAFRNFEELLAILRAVSRRDPAVTIEHSISYLGTAAIWLAGSESLRAAAARVILAPSRVALGLTERAHGGDLLACDFRAERSEGGYRLSGEKWLINNATRGAAITLFARTDPRGGPRGFSLFFVEKAKLPEGAFESLPPIPTLGIRAVDISGARLRDAYVTSDALIGQLGHGLEIIMKSLQVTRTMCVSLTLGGLDTALRTTVRFARSRHVLRTSVLELPLPRAVLANAFADLWLCECAGIAATRALHTAPEQMSVVSAAIKHFVPVTGEQVIRNLAVVLGARYYLREGQDHGMFQKLLRDAAIVSLFDGSSVLNLSLINSQLPDLVARRAATPARRTDDELVAALRRTYALDEPLPEFAPERLALHNRGAVDAVDGIALALDALDGIASGAGPEAEAARESARWLLALSEERGRLVPQMEALTTVAPDGLAALPETFELSRRYAAIYVGSSCAHFFLHNRRTLGDFFARGEWLALALRRLVALFRPELLVAPGLFVERVAAELAERVEVGMHLSVVPLSAASLSRDSA